MARSRKPQQPSVSTSRVSRSPSSASRSDQSSPDRPSGPLSFITNPDDREEVKVNNANLTELKNACDDAVKRLLSRPDLFKQIHLHTDVRLALGWAGVFVAGGTGLYGYKVEFEKSKPVVWTGLIIYIVLTVLQTLYSYFIEGDIIFVGKRKTFSKRIITERLTLSSTTIPISKSSPPSYQLSLTYVRSTSSGKSLLARGKTKESKEYNAFFDENGVMDQEVFETWVGQLVENGMEGKVT